MLATCSWGVVLTAVQKKTGSGVIVKVVEKSGLNVHELNDVRQECALLKCCDHPNLVRLLDLFETREQIYIVLERLSGGDLLTYLETRGEGYPQAQALAIVRDLTSLLEYVHERGVVVGNITLNSLLRSCVTESSKVKLASLRFARFLGPADAPAEAFNALPWKAPEVCDLQRCGKPLDVWGLGVVLCFLLGARLPLHVPAFQATEYLS